MDNQPVAYTHRHRVRYRECDRMGVVYHTHYLDYFEAARTEALRETGVTYRELEDSGIMMPVVDLSVKYRRPAHYDDLLAVECYFPEPPDTRLLTTYEVRRADAADESGSENGAGSGAGETRPLVTGSVTLCFVDKDTGRPTQAPEAVRKLLAENTVDA